jgi:hypothetical protein
MAANSSTAVDDSRMPLSSAPAGESKLLASTDAAKRALDVILKKWSIKSIEDAAPASIAPSYWNEHMLKKMATLARVETLESAQLLLREQFQRRRCDEEGKGVRMVTERLIGRDFNDILKNPKYQHRRSTFNPGRSPSQSTAADTPVTGNSPEGVSETVRPNYAFLSFHSTITCC